MTQQELRDRQGRLLGKIETNGSKQTIRDAQGRLLGTSEGRQNKNDNLLSKIVVLGPGYRDSSCILQ